VTTKRILFWCAVGAVGGVMAPFAVALVGNKTGLPGLQKFRAFTYGAPTS
jgi:hypothetical protein